MTTLEIKAIDTLFFRDGKPFSMGEETLAQGVFPPYPSTLYGTLRSVYFADHLPDLKLANLQGDPTANLTIKSYLPFLNSQPAFPIPQDLYGKKREDALEAWPLVCHLNPDGLVSDYGYEYMLQTQETTKVEELGGKAFLDKEQFIKYLEGGPEKLTYHKLADYVKDEPKIGIGRDAATRTASEGRLYRVNMKRLDGQNGKLSLTVGFNGLQVSGNGLSRMGAEMKGVSFQTLNDGSVSKVESPVKKGDNRFKIYLATPAIFLDGPCPTSWFANNGLRLLTAAVGRVQYVGGFDYKENEPKPMQKAVPAGTVYYVEIIDAEKANGLVEMLHRGSIYELAEATDPYRKEYQKQGFGLTYLGKFNIQ